MDVWWDEIAAALGKPLEFPAKENEQECTIAPLSSEGHAEGPMLMVYKTVLIPGRKPVVKEYPIMAWRNLGDSSNGCPYNRKHVKGEVKVCESTLFFPILRCCNS
jgi:hypothetical protein